jgi:hypothetical protein
MMANREEGEWEKTKIKRGQLATGLKSLSQDTGISVQSIRTCLDRLKSTNEITIQPTNKFSIITICKYDLYQDNIYSSNNRINNQTNKQLTNNQQTTNNKQEEEEDKEEIKKEIIYKEKNQEEDLTWQEKYDRFCGKPIEGFKPPEEEPITIPVKTDSKFFKDHPEFEPCD